MIFAGSLQPGQWWWWWSSSSSPSSPSSSSSSPSSSSSLPVVSGRDASEACDGLRWVWTLWHWKTEGLDFWEERSIWIELCSHPPKNLQIFSQKKMDDEIFWIFTRLTLRAKIWLIRHFTENEEMEPSAAPLTHLRFSRTLAEMWHPLKAAIPQHQNHQKRFHPCVWRSYSVFVVFYQSVLVKDFEIDAHEL